MIRPGITIRYYLGTTSSVEPVSSIADALGYLNDRQPVGDSAYLYLDRGCLKSARVRFWRGADGQWRRDRRMK